MTGISWGMAAEWNKALVLSVGGILGVNARYWLGVWMSRWTSPQFPWATVVINISGSFLIGLLTVALARWMPHPNIRLMVITGFLGAYTTFSTFENDTLNLWERGEGLLAAANVIGSVAVGFLAVVLGTALAHSLSEPAPLPAAAAAGHGATTAAQRAGANSSGERPSIVPANDLPGASRARDQDQL